MVVVKGMVNERRGGGGEGDSEGERGWRWW